jgi:hypothetical protein
MIFHDFNDFFEVAAETLITHLKGGGSQYFLEITQRSLVYENLPG